MQERIERCRPAGHTYRRRMAGNGRSASQRSRTRSSRLHALAFGIKGRNVHWILDADIRSFFDRISHDWLVRFLEHRIGDRRIIRLIRKWLKAGVLEDGRHVATEEGTPKAR